MNAVENNTTAGTPLDWQPQRAAPHPLQHITARMLCRYKARDTIESHAGAATLLSIRAHRSEKPPAPGSTAQLPAKLKRATHEQLALSDVLMSSLCWCRCLVIHAGLVPTWDSTPMARDTPNSTV
jgi:hypothetical protein